MTSYIFKNFLLTFASLFIGFIMNHHYLLFYDVKPILLYDEPQSNGMNKNKDQLNVGVKELRDWFIVS